MITEELRAVLTAAGVTPDATKVNQVATAISDLISSAIGAATINWNQIQNVPSNTGAVANTLALRDASADLTAAGFNVSSDVRLKADVKPISGALDRLDLYRGVTYRRKGSDQLYGGFLAHEFEKARPEGVRKDKRGFKRIDLMAVIAELKEALHEERDTRRQLEERVKALEAR